MKFRFLDLMFILAWCLLAFGVYHNTDFHDRATCYDVHEGDVVTYVDGHVSMSHLDDEGHDQVSTFEDHQHNAHQWSELMQGKPDTYSEFYCVEK